MKRKIVSFFIGVIFVVSFTVFLKLFGISVSDEIVDIFNGNKQSVCTLTPKQNEFKHELFYEGPLIDAHLHLPTSSEIVSAVSTRIGHPTQVWDKNFTIDYVHCLLKIERRPKAFGFHFTTKYSSSGEVRIAKRMEKRYPGEMAHFLMPAFISPWINPSIQTVKDMLEKNPGLFVGLGELKMFDGRNPDDPYMMELYELAKKYNLVIMMHPFINHLEAVEKIVAQYPEVKFLFHGIDKTSRGGPRQEKDNIEWVMKLIRENKNAYYSLDDPLSIYGFKKEHEDKVVPKDELILHMREEFDGLLKSHLGRWKSRVKAYPDQFVGGGSDRQHRPHFDQELSGLINEFDRAFIGQLPVEVQEKFAYKNAEKLLGLSDD